MMFDARTKLQFHRRGSIALGFPLSKYDRVVDDAPAQQVAASPAGWTAILRPVILTVAALAGIFAMSMPTNAQRSSDQHASTPLSLEEVGSFFVGGRTVSQTSNQVGLYNGGPVAVDQMYVQYMVPQGHQKPAVVMVHGATLTGASFETTPDGRMGWYEYFARKGYPSYLVDQVGRGRSGFNQAPFNDVRAGIAAHGSQPLLRRVAEDVAWVRFRAGPTAGVKFEDTQFPVEAIEAFSKQAVPDLAQSMPPADPNYAALSELSQKLGDTVLLGHSQAGRYPFETALLNPKGIRSLIAVEPPGCNANVYSDEQISKLAKFPILVVFGDHLDTPQSVGPNWFPFFKDCEAFVARINAANGNARMLHPVELGIHGNSHMIMQDKNNLEIANLIMKWINKP